MKTARAAAIVLCGLVVSQACGGDGGGGPSPSDLSGTWHLTHCEYVSTGGLGRIDLIADGGSGTMTLTTDDTLRLTVTPVSGAPVSLIATYVVEGTDLMRVTPAGASWYWAFDMSYSGAKLVLRNGSAQYDIDNDGTPDPAIWNMTMTR